MKPRLIKAQNQRVERITTSTLVIGVDIAKEKQTQAYSLPACSQPP